MAEQKMHGFRARLDYILKHNYAINRIFNWMASSFMKVWGYFIPLDDEMVIFSGHTRRYNDSMGHRTKRILRIERKEYQTY